ncbi:MAG: class I SAM-dependent methyltransferase [Anaerolineaceae bacterium]
MDDGLQKFYLKSEEQQAFSGWDFSYLNGRWKGELQPWNYREVVRKHLKTGMKLLDMGTGGGEFIQSLDHPFSLISVTEGYEPNYKLCLQKLAPLGIQVRFVSEDNLLDFPDNSFDLVLNRHESFSASEVWRVLIPGGFFITQQVGGQNDADLSRKLIPSYLPALPDHDLEHNLALLKEQNFLILSAQESFTPIRFFDLGALVYFAKIIEWEFPGFSVDSCYEKLITLNDELQAKGYIEGTEHRFILAAQKLHSTK